MPDYNSNKGILQIVLIYKMLNNVFLKCKAGRLYLCDYERRGDQKISLRILLKSVIIIAKKSEDRSQRSGEKICEGDD